VILEGDKVYNRSIPIAGRNITREIAQMFGCTIDEAEALKIERGYVSLGGVAEDEDETSDRISEVCRAVMTRLQAEISRSVNFYRSQQGGGAPVKLYLTGGTALLPQIDSFFAESLQVDVEFFNPFDFIVPGSGIDVEALGADGALLSPTAGLALHMAGLARFAINLLPPSILAARAERAKIPVLAVAGGLLIVSLVLVLLGVGRQTENLQATIDGIQSKVTTLRSFEKKLKDAEASVAREQASADAVRKILNARYAALARLMAVRGSLSGGMWIHSWQDGKITVRGWKDRLDKMVSDAARLSGGKRLTASELVVAKLKGCVVVVPESVKISDMTTLGKGAALEQFTVELKFK
jgi:hypothetical protein